MNISSSQKVVWDEMVGATGYDLELVNEAQGTSYGVFPTADAEINATEFLVGRAFGNYFVRVRATEAAGPGEWSSYVAITFVSLGAPQNIHVE